jgi:hypothetical protein
MGVVVNGSLAGQRWVVAVVWCVLDGAVVAWWW